MPFDRVRTSRRLLLQTASILAASTLVEPARAVAAPLSSARTGVFGTAGFVPNSRVDPRDYLPAGKTWTTVVCIRPALQAALDEAHLRASADPKAVVELVIPPGVGRLTTTCPQPLLNRSSQQNPRAVYDTRIGLGLRANIQGKILIRGAGGQNRKSVIRLSDAARNLFWVDSDTGIEWLDTVGKESSGLPAQRPKTPLMLRNVMFQGFGVDNNDSGGNCHIVCGTVPAATSPQRYVSVQNVHALDIDVWGMRQELAVEAQAKRNKAPFAFTARHFSDYEANGGQGAGKAAGHEWGRWDLTTLAGRGAAHKAGWTWMHGMSFERVRSTNTTRGIIVVGEPHRFYSHWVDDISIRSCEHLQDRPYTEGNVPQTSFFIGGSCQGGKAVLTDCVSRNVGDDGIEIGGMSDVRITRFTSHNACLAGIYLRYGQRPLDWAKSIVVVEDSTFTIDGSALQHSQKGSFRSIPIDAKFGDDAAESAIGVLQVNRCTTIIDGVHPSDATAPRGVLDKLVRRNRYGWFLNGPIATATFSGCSAILRNIDLGSSNAKRVYQVIMWHAQQKLPTVLGVAPKITLTDCSTTISGMRTKGAQGEFIGVAAHSAGASSTVRMSVTMSDCGSTFQRADLARIGWLPADSTVVASKSNTIQTLVGRMTTSTPKTRRAVVQYADQPVASSSVAGVSFSGWGAARALEKGP